MRQCSQQCSSFPANLIAQESAQQREDPCNATESFNQFDFWVAEWTVTTADDRT